MITRRSLLQSGAAAAFLAPSLRAARAETPGVSDTAIRIGQTMPYSGPASAYGAIGRTEAAYFRMINEQGGVNGRKIEFLSLDDGYSPPRTLEQTRRLVEDEKVAFLFQTLGTAPNLAIRQYCNDNKVPQLFAASGADMFADPARYPWTMGYNPSYQTEARIYGKHILATKPEARIAVLFQDDGFGRDYLGALKEALGDKAATAIVKAASYETSEPTVDSQVISLQASGADVFVIIATPKAAAQAIRKSYDLGWEATRYLSNVSPSIATVLKPAGLQRSKGLITNGYVIDVFDLRWRDEPSLRAFEAFTDKYMSLKDYSDMDAAYAFGAAATMVEVLKRCGNDLSRENVMRQATNLKAFAAPMLIPGITVDTSPDNFRPIRELQLMTFDGMSWQVTGAVMHD